MGHVKRLLENTAGDELVDKTDKVTYDIYLQTRDLKDVREAEKQYTKTNTLTVRTTEILEAAKAEEAKLGSALDAAAASLDKTLEKVDRQMDAVCSFAASVGVEKEVTIQLLCQGSSSAHGGNMAR
ncbi:hypothetical protein AAVH_04369 [Aphelenchoides avenae]|nr:hypothetical protein AAVH_04369 [Aphelenchus avenae]